MKIITTYIIFIYLFLDLTSGMKKTKNSGAVVCPTGPSKHTRNKFPVKISTMNYPSPYPKKATCNIFINVPKNEKVRILCPTLDINGGDQDCVDGHIRFNGLLPKSLNKKKKCDNPFSLIVDPQDKSYKIFMQFKSKLTKKQKSGFGFQCQIDLVSNIDPKDECFCGIPSGKEFEKVGTLTNSRFHYGENTKPHEFPWHIGILDYNHLTNTYFLFCDGALISSRVVMTTGTCVNGRSIDNTFVDVGDHVLQDFGKDGNFIVPVKEIAIHPGYNYTSQYVNDYALIVLKYDIDFYKNSHVRPICLPEVKPMEYHVNDVGIVTSFGTDFHGSTSILQKYDKTILSQISCSAAFQFMSQIHIGDSIMCAQNFNQFSCTPIKGGPLQKMSQKSYYELLGLASFGNCAEGLPTGFSRITALLKPYQQWWPDAPHDQGYFCPKKI